MANKEVEKVSKVLEEAWEPKAFAEYFMDKKEEKLAEIVGDELRELGYPARANYINTQFEFFCINNKSFDDWAVIATEQYLNETDDKSIHQFIAQSREMDMYLDHLENFTYKVKFDLTPEQFEERFPSHETVTKVLEENWDEAELVRKMLEDDAYEPLLEKIYEQLQENGFPEPQQIDLTQIRYTVSIANKLDYEAWAEIAIEQYIYYSIERFKSNEMFKMYLEHPESLDIKVRIETELDEWEMER